MQIRERVSGILGMPIQEGMWKRYIDVLDRDGKISKKVQLEILLALCEAVETLEKDYEPKTAAKKSV